MSGPALIINALMTALLSLGQGLNLLFKTIERIEKKIAKKYQAPDLVETTFYSQEQYKKLTQIQ